VQWDKKHGRNFGVSSVRIVHTLDVIEQENLDLYLNPKFKSSLYSSLIGVGRSEELNKTIGG